MSLPQFLLKDSTRSLEYYPPEQAGLGKVTAATVRVATPSTSLPTTGDAATADLSTVDTTLSANASAGDKSVTVASATGITAGRRYVIGGTDGMYDPVVVEVRRVSGTTVYLRRKLLVDVTSGDVFAGYRVFHALTATETSQRGKGFAEWTVTIDGEAHVYAQTFYVVEYEFNHGLTPGELRTRHPILEKLKDPDDDTLHLAIEAGFDAMLATVQSRKLDVWNIVDAEFFREPLGFHVVNNLVQSSTRFEVETLEAWERNTTASFERFMQNSEAWYNATGSLDTPTEDTLGAFSFTEYTR